MKTARTFRTRSGLGIWAYLVALLGISSALALIACGEDDKETSYMDISAVAAKAKLDANADLVVIDVSPYWDQGHLPGALSYPLSSGAFDAAYKSFDKSKEYLVYCHADAPAIEAAGKLVAEGFDPVYRLQGNYQAWVDAGYAVETP